MSHTTIMKATLSHATMERSELRNRIAELEDALNHWQSVTGFGTPEETVRAVNKRFEDNLPSGLAKSLWKIERSESEAKDRRIAELEAARKWRTDDPPKDRPFLAKRYPDPWVMKWDEDYGAFLSAPGLLSVPGRRWDKFTEWMEIPGGNNAAV